MEARPREVRHYETSDGRAPYWEWFEGLRDVVTRGRIRERVDRLEDGNFGDCEALGRGLYELRLDFDGGYRVYVGEVSRTVVLLLFGGGKKKQERDIKKAQEYWKEFKSRKHE